MAGALPPAERRGRRSGDIVVGIGGASVGSYDDFYKALDEHRAGDQVDVKILRATA